jgi:hypothetical protein
MISLGKFSCLLTSRTLGNCFYRTETIKGQCHKLHDYSEPTLQVDGVFRGWLIYLSIVVEGRGWLIYLSIVVEGRGWLIYLSIVVEDIPDHLLVLCEPLPRNDGVFT